MQPWKKFGMSLGFLIATQINAANVIASPTPSTQIFSQSPQSTSVSLQNVLLPFRLVAGVEGGIGLLPHIGQSQSFAGTSDDNYFNYSANNTLQSSALIGGFIGAEYAFPMHPAWAVQFGIAYNSMFPFSVSGNNLVGTGDSTLYHYNYHISSQQLFAESKWLATLYTRYHPYLLIDLGAAFNNSYSFQASSPPSDTFNPNALYSSHTTTNFAYGLGAGIDIDIIEHLRAGIGYRFADLGTAKLGQGQVSWNGIPLGPALPGLKQSPLYINEVFAQLTYLL